MKSLNDFNNHQLKYVFTDIDDTLTSDGKLQSAPYKALWDLSTSGIKVIPVTGRPAGWCEMIARFWPVDGVIGENGGFYFTYQKKTMLRYYAQDKNTRIQNQKKLENIKIEILKNIPGAGIASDQFCRQLDLAIDFCEDVSPLTAQEVSKIVDIFKAYGAQAKISSIHVNGWFGDHNKLSMCKIYCEKQLGFNLNTHQDHCAFIGDSPNDEPMFEFFNNSFAVQNINKFVHQLKAKPCYITPSKGGEGFCEFVQQLLKTSK